MLITPPASAPAARPAAPPEQQHVVMFYDAEAVLLDTVAAYLAPVLRAGERGILVATPEHLAGVEARLRAIGLDLQAARSGGAYITCDARATLARFMRAGLPDPDAFGAILEYLLDGVPAASHVRIFGEMVALLVADEQRDAALALEALWREAQTRREFMLLCAYPMRLFGARAHTERFAETCLAHTSVLAADAELGEYRRTVQQLAHALEVERAARAAAEAALRAREEFLSTAAHELRTPLAAVGVQAQLSLRNWSRTGELETERTVRALRAIGDQAAKLGRMIDQLLDLSRVDSDKLSLEPEVINLVDLVDQAVSMARGIAEQQAIDVVTPVALICQVDPIRIGQVLTNLLDNAIKYSPAGRPIEVRLAQADAAWLELSVRDHGPGIPAEHRERIFERFFQAETCVGRQGLGLGLYLSRSIVEQHGGTLSVEFPADGGTRFVVRLPTTPCGSSSRI